MKRLLTYISILTFAFSASATHIVGGDVTYEHITQNEYIVTLHLYIDCVNGTQGAINLDTVANISYFDAVSNTLLSYDPIPVLTKINVEKLNYKCLKVEPNACVQQFSYSYNKTIEPGPNGVIIAFQRCCRNKTITNLLNPEDIGATFFALVPPVSQVINNSSAVFKNLPPNFLCTSAPLVFDHSAEDKDGDSLVYSILLPYDGATPFSPRPVPANNPPFKEVLMSSTYGVANMMNGTVLLQIDPITGLLRVTPSDAGQFVVAIKVDEYRDGILINEGFRDYQLNVIDCEIDLIANFAGPDLSCKKEITFDNMSLGESLRYLWDFGEEDRTNDVSSDEDGQWTYSKNGTYNVQLIVYNDACKDTFSKPITILPVRYVSTHLDARPVLGCDSLTVFLNNTSDSATQYTWDFGDGSAKIINKEVKSHLYSKPGTYILSLSLVDSNTCNITDDTAIRIVINESTLHDVDFNLSYKTGCLADGLVNITSVQNEQDLHKWSISDGTEWDNNKKTAHRFKTKGYYTISLWSTDTSRCAANDTVTKEVYIEEVESAVEGIELYNVFTPDGDTYNQCFSIDVEKRDCIDIEYYIYNRWGELVYQAQGASDCWNGKDDRSGKDVPQGEYFGVYLINIKGDSEQHRLSNVISLIRE